MVTYQVFPEYECPIMWSVPPLTQIYAIDGDSFIPIYNAADGKILNKWKSDS